MTRWARTSSPSTPARLSRPSGSTIHDTAADGTAPFDANAAAKAAKGTPLKRPENAKFVPGTDFRSFVVAETGDTSKPAGDEPGAAARAAWGALLRVDMPKAGADSATVKALVVGDQAHASFDNVAFLDKRTVLLTEDRGETLHQQANALDSLWSFDITKPLNQANADAKRVIAQGRDPEATGDIAIKEPAPPTALTHNDGDNELTGIHVSDGSTSPSGILGSELPNNAGAWQPMADLRHRPARGEHHLRDRRHEVQEARVTGPTGPRRRAAVALLLADGVAGTDDGDVHARGCPSVPCSADAAGPRLRGRRGPGPR